MSGEVAVKELYMCTRWWCLFKGVITRNRVCPHCREENEKVDLTCCG